MDVVAYEAFKKKRAKDFRSIAAQTNGAMEVEELHAEAWLAADHLGHKRGQEIDWSNPEDQNLIFKVLTVQHVWRKRAERGLTVSADEEHEDGDGATSLISLLPDENMVDPLEMLQRREEEEQDKVTREEEDAILESYSESVAYTVVLWHFSNIRTRLAAYLVIHRNTLKKRIDEAAKVLKVQPSLFDRVEKITSSFWPSEGQKCYREITQHLAGQQWYWDF